MVFNALKSVTQSYQPINNRFLIDLTICLPEAFALLSSSFARECRSEWLEVGKERFSTFFNEVEPLSRVGTTSNASSIRVDGN